MKYVIELNFKSGVRFGADIFGERNEAASGYIHADTIFSALLNSLHKRSDEYKTCSWYSHMISGNADELPFSISSNGFVDTAGSQHKYYIPKPIAFPQNISEHPELKQLQKEFNKRSFISIETFHNWQKKEALNLERILDNEKELFWLLDNRARHATDRSSSQSLLFRTAQVFYQKHVQPFFVIDIPDESLLPFADLLKLISELNFDGLGGKRSIGLGSFTIKDDGWFQIAGHSVTQHREINPAFTREKLDAVQLFNSIFSFQSNNFYNFSTFFPVNFSTDQIQSTRLLSRKGWYYSTSSLAQLKRKSCFMLAEGTITSSKVKGSIVDLRPQDNRCTHAIFRYGIPFYLPF